MLGDGSSIEATILDVSNPIVLVRAEDIGVTGLEMPDAIDRDKQLSERLERIRGAACVQMGFAEDLEDATKSSPAVPKVGFVARPGTYRDIAGKTVLRDELDIAARVISVFKCHKACPLTSASAISVAAFYRAVSWRRCCKRPRNAELLYASAIRRVSSRCTQN